MTSTPGEMGSRFLDGEQDQESTSVRKNIEVDSFGKHKRQYQISAIDFIVKRRLNAILRAPTGAGKTHIALRSAEACRVSRIVIFVRRYSGYLSWLKQLSESSFASTHNIIAMEKFDKEHRQAIWENAKDTDDNEIIICLYATMLRDKQLIERAKVGVFMCDECHILSNPRNITTKAYIRIARITKASTLFLSDTMMSKGPQNLFAYLHILSPKIFSSYWEFVNRYCVMDQGFKGKEIIAVKKSTKPELLARISGFMKNITDADVAGWVPYRMREVLNVGSPDKKVLKLMSKALTDMMFKTSDGDLRVIKSYLTSNLVARQLLTCPALVDTKLGCGIAIDEIVDHAKNRMDVVHFMLATEFVSAFPHFKKRLESISHALKVFTIIGGMSPSEIVDEIESFADCKRNKVDSVLLCGTGVAESFDVMSCDTGYMLGYPYSTTVCRQTEGRLTRSSVEFPKAFCKFYYVTHGTAIESNVLNVLNTNSQNVTAVMRNK